MWNQFLTLVFSLVISLSTKLNSQIQVPTNCHNNVVNIMPVEDIYACNYDRYMLVFEDDFEGNTLDLNKWNPLTGVPRDLYFTSQKAWHKPENIEVNNGSLKIISKREALTSMPVVTNWNPYTVYYSDFDYTTGEVWTKKDFGYGKFEARIKIPQGKGFWPAFWLYGDKPYYNEIDIMEFWDDNTSKHHISVHAPWNGDTLHCETERIDTNYHNDFYIFSVIWEKDRTEFYVNNNLIRTDYHYYSLLGQPLCFLPGFQNNLMNVDYAVNPMAIIFNTAIQTGTYEPDANTTFPVQLEVDWVKYYKKIPCNDVVISSSSQVPSSTIQYNSIGGLNVNISCDYSNVQNSQLSVVAKNSVNLLPGFITDPNAFLEVSVDVNACLSTRMEQTFQNVNFEDSIKTSNLLSDNEVVLYPNPTNGLFTLNFGADEFESYQMTISDISGKDLYYNYSLDSNKSIINVDFSNMSSGIYYIKVNNILTNKVKYFKLLKQ